MNLNGSADWQTVLLNPGDSVAELYQLRVILSRINVLNSVTGFSFL
jgi:hypothetical protein